MAAKGAGRTTRRYKQLSRELASRRLPCWLCGQPIDYTLPREHPDAFSVDHAKALSLRPDLAEDPANLRASHSRCNKSRGNRDPKPSLGQQSQPW